MKEIKKKRVIIILLDKDENNKDMSKKLLYNYLTYLLNCLVSKYKIRQTFVTTMMS